MKITEIICESPQPSLADIQRKFAEFMRSKEEELGEITEAPVDPRFATDRIRMSPKSNPPKVDPKFAKERVRTSTPAPEKKRSSPHATPAKPTPSPPKEPTMGSWRAALNGNMNNAQQGAYFGRLVGTAILWAALYYGFTAWTDNKVVNDSVREFEITQKYGSRVDQYVHAGIVSAAMLQKGDQEGYRRWKDIENQLKPR